MNYHFDDINVDDIMDEKTKVSVCCCCAFPSLSLSYLLGLVETDFITKHTHTCTASPQSATFAEADKDSKDIAKVWLEQPDGDYQAGWCSYGDLFAGDMALAKGIHPSLFGFIFVLLSLLIVFAHLP